ncbi:aminotransferase class IV [Brevundimonas sp.]|uniref:aminotransferase class IV n=1 Tax=Brevundimonas sp. TaxID=1871086 RepID=UPI002605A775|nr:aminotransferase class IV [Brevundimonas sp.]
MTDFLIDGLPPTDDDLRYLALVNYGAYTSFRVEDGGVRGLDLHLARIDASAIELFGEPVGEDRLRGLIRTAVADRPDAWIRLSLFAPEIVPRSPSAEVRPKVMTSVSPAPSPLATSVRAQVRAYVRTEAQLKHTAIFPLIRARRLARQAGFDDALFADAEDLISEGATWNIGFLAGDTVTWPEAPMLHGVAKALISSRLAEVGMTQRTAAVHVSDLDAFDGAFLCNSATPACPITAIGDKVFGAAPERIERLARAWSSNPPQAI